MDLFEEKIRRIMMAQILKKNKFDASSFMALFQPHNVQLMNPGPIGYTCYMIALPLCYTPFNLSAFFTISEKIVLFSLEYYFGHIILFLLFVFWTGHKFDVFLISVDRIVVSIFGTLVRRGVRLAAVLVASLANSDLARNPHLLILTGWSANHQWPET